MNVEDMSDEDKRRWVSIQLTTADVGKALFEVLGEVPAGIAVPALAYAVSDFCQASAIPGMALFGLRRIYELAKQDIENTQTTSPENDG